MRARVGDPILSADGKTIVAKWNCSMVFAARDISVAVMPDMATAVSLAELPPEERMEKTPRITMFVTAEMPDRTYWKLVRSVPTEWLWDRNRYFTHPDADTGPKNPRGMIAAIDELLTRHKPSFGDASWLQYIRGYYQSLADRP